MEIKAKGCQFNATNYYADTTDVYLINTTAEVEGNKIIIPSPFIHQGPTNAMLTV